MEQPVEIIEEEVDALPTPVGGDHRSRRCRHHAAVDPGIVSDLPPQFPITSEEIGLLRAFFASEIAAILSSKD